MAFMVLLATQNSLLHRCIIVEPPLLVCSAGKKPSETRIFVMYLTKAKSFFIFLKMWKWFILQSGLNFIRIPSTNPLFSYKTYRCISIRPVAIGRKNYLFAGNHEAAQRSAMLYSLFATCKLHGVNSNQWLTYVFENINDHKINAIEELLPQNYAASLTKKWWGWWRRYIWRACDSS